MGCIGVTQTRDIKFCKYYLWTALYRGFNCQRKLVLRSKFNQYYKSLPTSAICVLCDHGVPGVFFLLNIGFSHRYGLEMFYWGVAHDRQQPCIYAKDSMKKLSVFGYYLSTTLLHKLNLYPYKTCLIGRHFPCSELRFTDYIHRNHLLFLTGSDLYYQETIFSSTNAFMAVLYIITTYNNSGHLIGSELFSNCAMR